MPYQIKENIMLSQKFSYLLSITFLTAAPSYGTLTFSFSPDQDGFTAVTISGSGTLGLSGTYSSTAASLGNISEGNPAAAPWDGTGSSPYLLGLNSASINAGTQSFSLNFAFVEDDNAGGPAGNNQDDFVFQFTNLENVASGTTFVASGAARLLDTQNTFGNGANAPIPFEGLTPGTYTDPTDAQSLFFEGVNIVITNTPITLIPEPSSIALLSFGFMSFGLRRRRK